MGGRTPVKTCCRPSTSSERASACSAATCCPGPRAWRVHRATATLEGRGPCRRRRRDRARPCVPHGASSRRCRRRGRRPPPPWPRRAPGEAGTSDPAPRGPPGRQRARPRRTGTPTRGHRLPMRRAPSASRACRRTQRWRHPRITTMVVPITRHRNLSSMIRDRGATLSGPRRRQTTVSQGGRRLPRASTAKESLAADPRGGSKRVRDRARDDRRQGRRAAGLPTPATRR